MWMDSWADLSLQKALPKLAMSTGRATPMVGDESPRIPRSCFAVTVIVVAFVAIVGSAAQGAFTGFLGLTLSQAILRIARPYDMGYYVADAHSTMRVGAVGGAVLGVVFAAVTLGVFSSGGQSGADMMTPVFTVFGAASGPLGVVRLKHYRNASERAAMLDVLHAARVGAFGWFLLGVLAYQRYREALVTKDKDGL